MVVAMQYLYKDIDCDHEEVRRYENLKMVVNVPTCLTSTTPMCCVVCRASSLLFIADRVVDVHSHDKEMLYAHGTTMSVADAVAVVRSKCEPSKWYSSDKWCTAFVVTPHDVEEISKNFSMLEALPKDDVEKHGGIENMMPSWFVDDDEVSLFPTYEEDTLLDTLFDSEIRLSFHRYLRPGDVVVRATIMYVESFEAVDTAMTRHDYLEMLNTEGYEKLYERLDSICGNAGDTTSRFNKFHVILRPLRGWARVRHRVRLHVIVVFWLSLTEKLMAPGGSARKRDYEDFQSESLFLETGEKEQ